MVIRVKRHKTKPITKEVSGGQTKGISGRAGLYDELGRRRELLPRERAAVRERIEEVL